jgi:predicted dehydrogenase
MAAHYNARAFSSIEGMLKDADIDIVDICTPTPFHLECIKTAAAAGKHVICEKPFARTMEQCREAVEACEAAGVRLFIAHVLRYFPEFAQARQVVKSGTVGKPVTVRTTRGGGYPMGWDDWYGNIEWSGGVALDLIIHDFDWLLWTFGPAERVFAKGMAHSGRKHADYGLVTIRFKSGMIAHVEGTWCKPSGFQVKVEIVGDGGLINFTNKETVPLVVERKLSEESGGGVPVPESPLATNPYQMELEHFINCVETGSECDITPQDAMNAVEISLAALESMKTGQPVQVG